LFLKESPRRVKPLLSVYRVLLTGIHLMRTGTVEANLVTLNEEFRLPYLAELVARKLAGPEKSKLEDADRRSTSRNTSGCVACSRRRMTRASCQSCRAPKRAGR
jgi:predicted nucleotidyltransferase